MKMKKRIISILLCLVMLLGMLPKTSLTALAVEYSGEVGFYDLVSGDILNPGVEISVSGNMTVILQAEGWISEGSYVAVGEPKQFQTQTISIGNEGCIEVTEEYGHTNCYPYANGEKVSTWTVVETSWESNTITLTGYSSSSGITGPRTLNKDTDLDADINGCVIIDGIVTLDLKGHNIIGDGENSTITISEGSTLILTDSNSDNRGMIISGAGDKGGGVLVSKNSNFYMRNGNIGGMINGTIFSNKASSGGGVYVDNGGTFEMYGGAIICNKASEGGGVYVDDGGTFNMANGVIGGNTADQNGGGVYFAGNTFTMSGGNIGGENKASCGGGVFNASTFNISSNAIITNNTADVEGGGIYSEGTLNVTGGQITNNKCENTEKGYAGVCIKDGTFTLSGGPVIDGNTHGSTEEDICLYPDKIIAVSGALTMANTMSVRRTDSDGNDNQTGAIAQGSGGYTLTEADGGKFVASTTGCEAVFDSTNQNEQLVAVSASTFAVTYNGNGNTSGTVPVDSNSPYTSGSSVTVMDNTGSLVKDGSTFNGWNTAADGSGTSYAAEATFRITADTTLYAQWDEASHSHNWSYTSNGATVTATCSGDGSCDITGGLTLTISAPAGTLVYDGTTTYPATLSTGYNTTAFPDAYNISYTKDSSAFNGMPKDAGVYTASVTVGTVTASVSYTIAKADPTTPSGLTATYGQTLADVTLPTGWAWADSTTSVGNVGTNTFKANYTAPDANYNSKTGVDVEVTVSAADVAVTKAPTANTLTYNGRTQKLVTEGEATGGTMYYALGKNTTTAPAGSLYTTSIPAETNAGTYYVWYKAVGDGNYKESDAACIAVSIAKASITIRADDKSSKYGEDLKELTYRVSGAYVASDSLDVSVSTIATRFSTPAEYPIVVSWNSDSNYRAELVDGTYTITQNDFEVNVSGYTGKYDGKGHGIRVEVITDNTMNNNVSNNNVKIYYASVELTADNYKTLGSTLNLLYTDAGEYTVYYYVASDNGGATPEKGSAVVMIEKAAPEVTAPEPVTGLSYTGEKQTLVTAGNAAGAEILYSLNGKDFSGELPAGIEAGSYTISYYYKGDQNHTDLGSAASPQGSFYVMISSSDMIGVSGHVFESDGSTPISGANVRLMKGKEQVAVSVTISGGAYQLAADEGRYNVIVEWNRDDANGSQDLVTKTELLNLKKETELDIVMPSGKVSSILQVTEGTPDVLVGGLDEEAALASEGASSVSVTMTVEKKEQGDGSETDALKEFAADKKLEYLSITVEKTVDSVKTVMAETQTVLEIIIPYSHLDKKGLMVYRCHNSETAALKKAKTKEDGTFRIDKTNGLVYIYTNRFSTYAIGYTQYYTVGSGLKLGSYTGEAKVTLQKQGESETVKQETVSVKKGAASYDWENIPKGTYDMAIEWKDGKKNTLMVPVNVE